jgi:hypothetical protein
VGVVRPKRPADHRRQTGEGHCEFAQSASCATVDSENNNEAIIIACIRGIVRVTTNTGQVAVARHHRRQSKHNHHQHDDEAHSERGYSLEGYGYLLDINQSRTPHARLEC